VIVIAAPAFNTEDKKAAVKKGARFMSSAGRFRHTKDELPVFPRVKLEEGFAGGLQIQ
jgi:hypothetical protein